MCYLEQNGTISILIGEFRVCHLLPYPGSNRHKPIYAEASDADELSHQQVYNGSKLPSDGYILHHTYVFPPAGNSL